MKKKNEKQKGIVSDISTVKGGFDEHKIACVASVSVWFRSKERGTRVNDRAKNGASEKAGRGFGGGEQSLSFHFSRGQNRKSPSLVFLCSETKRKRLLRRLSTKNFVTRYVKGINIIILHAIAC